MTPGLSSIAAGVIDHNDLPVAGVAVTYPEGPATPALVDAVRAAAGALSRRVAG